MLLCIYAIVNLLKVERGNPVEEAFPLFFCDDINKAPPKKNVPLGLSRLTILLELSFSIFAKL